MTQNEFITLNLKAVHYTLTNIMETRAMSRAGLNKEEWTNYKEVTSHLQDLITMVEVTSKEIDNLA